MRIFNFLIFLWDLIGEIKDMIKTLFDKEEKLLSKLVLITVGFIFIYLSYKLFIKLDNLLS
ncbi:MAG: hypothetical protein ACRDD2_01055 [Sarcina sp.]